MHILNGGIFHPFVFVGIFILSYVMMHKMEFTFVLFNIVILIDCEIQILEGGIFHSFIYVGILFV